MANITKKINPAIDSAARTQYWDTAAHTNDSGGAISAGDIFQIEASLGKAAKQMKLTTASGGSMSFRRNSQLTLYPSNAYKGDEDNQYQLLNSGQVLTDPTQNAIVVPLSTTYTFAGQPISTIEIVTKSGQFTLEVS